MTKPIITREQFSFWAEVEVRWGDMDAQGHVNNAVYFTYCETARIKLLRSIGVQGRSGGATSDAGRYRSSGAGNTCVETLAGQIALLSPCTSHDTAEQLNIKEKS
jgi:hypothetical protein